MTRMPILDFLKKKPDAEEPSSKTAEVSSGVSVSKTQEGMSFVLPLHISPLVSEKSTALQALHQYCVQAPYVSTKTQIGRMLKDAFHVHPLKIRMIPMAGKHVRYGRASGKTRRWKKYIVQLPSTEKLEMTPVTLH